jgi:hypothetical protein
MHRRDPAQQLSQGSLEFSGDVKMSRPSMRYLVQERSGKQVDGSQLGTFDNYPTIVMVPQPQCLCTVEQIGAQLFRNQHMFNVLWNPTREVDNLRKRGIHRALLRGQSLWTHEFELKSLSLLVLENLKIPHGISVRIV